MARELDFDGYWEGEAIYYCDNCDSEKRFRFDSEDDCDSKEHRAELRKNHGWITTMVNGQWKDFCSENCRNSYIRKNTL